MALKDLKSDLSKFRIPKKNPLESKERIDVNRKQNQTPLSSMVESAPKIPRSQTTTNKEGVEPRKFDNSPNFLGETTPSSTDNTVQFLGETTPNKADNSSQFLGETTPSKMDNSENFLGETTPNKFNLEERFLGETDPNKFDNSENFLGETNPNKFDNSENFLGETTPTPANNQSRFLGETTPTPANNQSRFLGETTPTSTNNTGQFLGETTPSSTDNTGQFLGETTPARFPYILRQENEGKEPGEVNYFSDIHANGFTSNMYPKGGPKKRSQFIGVDPSQTQFDGATSLYGTLDLTNFIVDDDATGFTKDMFPRGSSKKPSQFTGVDSAGTVFDEKSSEYSNTKSLYNGLSYRPGYGRFKFDKETGNVQRYSESNKYLIDNELTLLGISQLQEMRSSPSFLDEMYNKYNLKDDSFNTGLGLFRHPLILRGIQRKGISKGEPQSWGVLGVTFDDGLIRGGAITSTVRAAIDAARIGSWFASVEGLLWSTKQVGLQRTNRFAKIWTPINLLTSIGGQHIGLRPDRSGIIGLDVTGKYSEPIIGGYKDKIKKIYEKDTLSLSSFIGIPFSTQTDKRGGFDSLYGIGVTTTTRYENTFNNPSQRSGNETAKYTQKYEPLNTQAWFNPSNPDEFNTYSDDLPIDDEEAKNFGLAIQPNETGGGISSKTDGNPITNYETIAYGNIPKRGANDPIIDFRSLLDGDEKERAKNSDYTNKRLERKGTTFLSFPDYGQLTSADRIDYTKGTKEYDGVNASAVGDDEMNDLVKLLFQVHNDTSSRIQFRGTVSGITETFSPSWESFKYSGRADQAYKYTTFERSISFNFKVYPTSKAELIPMYRKLQHLSSMTMPQYGGANGYQGILVDFTLGNLWKKQLSFIEQLSYTFSDDTPWDIGEGASMGIDVQIGLKLLGNRLPQYRSKVYDLNGL